MKGPGCFSLSVRFASPDSVSRYSTLQTTLGITNASFVAQTADWNPPHVLATLRAAHRHPGLAFVRILQRCPHYPNPKLEELQSDPSQMLLLTHPEGIVLDEAMAKIFKNQLEHDPADLDGAREIAGRRDVTPIGLLYRNAAAQRYDLSSAEGLATSRADKIAALKSQLNQYRI